MNFELCPFVQLVIMDKEEQKATENKESVTQEVKEEEKEQTGFPEDVDFKKFLGCGG